MNQPVDHASVNLGNIQTQWSLIRKAHQMSVVGQSASSAREQMVMQYAPAIRRFVQLLVRDPDKADELSQDAVVRLLKGDFAGADPQRGRFRDLLKTAVRNMARNDWNRESRRQGVEFDLELLDGDETDAASRWEQEWTSRWRDTIMNLVWERLQQWEQQQPNSVAYTVLRLRAEKPEANSTELAELLSLQSGRSFKPDATRQQLRRARIRFTELLIEEIVNGMDDPDQQQITEELITLGLYASVKDVLPQEMLKSPESAH